MRVLALRAICDLSGGEARGGPQQSFDIGEFAVLDNGDQVNLHRERGFSGWTSGNDYWENSTNERIVRDVLTTVLPSEADPAEDHPFQWLAELARSRGIDVTADDLRSVPYEVVLTQRVLARIPPKPLVEA